MGGTVMHAGRGAALTAVLLVLASAAGCPGQEEEGTAGAPVRLADGSAPIALPSAVVAAAVKPVIGAKTITEQELVESSVVESCARSWMDLKSVAFFGAWLSPEGLSVAFTARGKRTLEGPAQRLLAACDWRWRGERWRAYGTGLAAWPDDPTLAASGDGLNLQGGPGRWVGFLWVTAPPGAAWVLVDRGSYWVAYRIEEGSPVRVSSTGGVQRASVMRVRVLFLDSAGMPIETREIEGVVAG
jgi:hypothetical protein